MPILVHIQGEKYPGGVRQRVKKGQSYVHVVIDDPLQSGLCNIHVICMYVFYNFKKEKRKRNRGRKKSRIHSYPSVDRNPETLPSAQSEMISPMCKKLVAPRISPIFVLVFMSIYDNRFQIQLITATLENSLPHGSSNIPTEIIIEMRILLIIKQTSELLEI